MTAHIRANNQSLCGVDCEQDELFSEAEAVAQDVCWECGAIAGIDPKHYDFKGEEDVLRALGAFDD